MEMRGIPPKDRFAYLRQRRNGDVEVITDYARDLAQGLEAFPAEYVDRHTSVLLRSIHIKLRGILHRRRLSDEERATVHAVVADVQKAILSLPDSLA